MSKPIQRTIFAVCDAAIILHKQGKEIVEVEELATMARLARAVKYAAHVHRRYVDAVIQQSTFVNNWWTDGEGGMYFLQPAEDTADGKTQVAIRYKEASAATAAEASAEREEI